MIDDWSTGLLDECVRSWNAKLNEQGDVAAFEAAVSQSESLAQSARSVSSSAAQSLAAQEEAVTPRDAGFSRPTQTMVQEVAALTQAERLRRAEQARGSLVKVWREKAAIDGKGKDFRGVISSDCMAGMEDLMKARKAMRMQVPDKFFFLSFKLMVKRIDFCLFRCSLIDIPFIEDPA